MVAQNVVSALDLKGKGGHGNSDLAVCQREREREIGDDDGDEDGDVVGE